MLGLDIGSHSIKAAVLTRTDKGIQLERALLAPLELDPSLPPNEKQQKVFDILSNLVGAGGIDVNQIYLALAAQSVLTRYVEILEVAKDKIEQTIKYEAQQQIPFSLDEVIWDYHLFYKTKGTKREALLVAVKKSVVEDTVGLIQRLRRDAALMDINILALHNAVRLSGLMEEDKLTAVIDIGARATNVVLSRESDIWVRSFPLAGNRFTEALQAKFQLSLAEAEKLKLSNLVGREEIKEVLKPVMEDLLAEVARSIEIYHLELEYDKNLAPGVQAEGGAPAGVAPGGALASLVQSREGPARGGRVEAVFLTGGGSQLTGLDQFFEERLSVKVGRLDLGKTLDILPPKEGDADPKLRNVLFGPAVGCALRGLMRCAVEIDFLKDINWGKEEKRESLIFKNAAIVLLGITLVFGFFVSSKEIGFKKGLVDARQGLVQVAKEYAPRMKDARREIEALEEQGALFSGIAKGRSLWLDVLLEIEGHLPQGVWLTSFSGRSQLAALDKGDVTLAGKALSYQEVNDLVAELKGSPLFKDVRPISSSLIRRSEGKDEIIEFTITMSLADQRSADTVAADHAESQG